MNEGAFIALILGGAGLGLYFVLKNADSAAQNPAPSPQEMGEPQGRVSNPTGEITGDWLSDLRSILGGLNPPDLINNFWSTGEKKTTSGEKYGPEQVIPRYDRPALRSAHIQNVDPMLIAIMQEARYRSPIDFDLTDGHRTLAEQKQLVADGKSQTLNSKHLEGRAVDIVALKPSGAADWNFETYRKINNVVQQVAAEMTTRKVTWGGSWRTFKDGVHFEIAPSNVA